MTYLHISVMHWTLHARLKNHNPNTWHVCTYFSDTVDLACQIEELRQVYQQVLHDNGKLHAQLKFHEDAVVVLMQEKNELLEKIHKYIVAFYV